MVFKFSLWKICANSCKFPASTASEQPYNKSVTLISPLNRFPGAETTTKRRSLSALTIFATSKMVEPLAIDVPPNLHTLIPIKTPTYAPVMFSASTTKNASTKQIALIQNFETNTFFKKVKNFIIYSPLPVFYLQAAIPASNNHATPSSTSLYQGNVPRCLALQSR